MKIIDQTKSWITFDFFSRRSNYLKAIFSAIIGENALQKYFFDGFASISQKKHKLLDIARYFFGRI